MQEKDVLNKYKSTISKQVRSYIGSQVLFLTVIAFLGSYLVFAVSGIWQKIVCGVLMFIYALSMYSPMYEIGSHDMRPYSTLKSYKWKGFVFGLIPAGLILLEWAVYAVVYQMQLRTLIKVIVNFIFVVTTFPYYSFLVPYSGYVMIYGLAIAVLFPILISGLGYIAGTKGFDLTARFGGFMYERKDKRK